MVLDGGDNDDAHLWEVNYAANNLRRILWLLINRFRRRPVYLQIGWNQFDSSKL